MSTENQQQTEEDYRLEDFTARQVHLIKSALMKEITRLSTREESKKLNKEQKRETKALKMETFEVYQKL